MLDPDSSFTMHMTSLFHLSRLFFLLYAVSHSWIISLTNAWTIYKPFFHARCYTPNFIGPYLFFSSPNLGELLFNNKMIGK